MFALKTKNNPIYTEQEFRRAIQREKDRADRYGSSFSCVIFESTGNRIPAKRQKNLFHAIVGRVRGIDEMGWVNGRDIGVLLAGTDTLGAHKVAEDIVSQFPQRQGAVSFSVQS